MDVPTKYLEHGRHLIYGLVDPVTAMVRYIGKSATGLLRPTQHTTPCLLAKDHTWKARWIRGLFAQGLRPTVRVLEVASPDVLDDMERYWIAQGHGLGWPLTNLTSGGEGFRGRHTEEAKRKTSAALLGRPKSAAHCAAISAGKLGKKQSPEHAANNGAARRGFKHSTESRQHMSDGKRGWSCPWLRRPLPVETRIKLAIAEGARPFVGPDGQIHHAVPVAAERYGINKATLRSLLKRGGTSRNGLKFRYVTEPAATGVAPCQ